MVNGLGVLGWGVGGIEAEAAMLGQPVSMLIPQVIGFKLSGELQEGATATDLVLTVTQMLRERGVVGKFVEFFGDGLARLPLADRATISNMAPEQGATCVMFPIDAETLHYLRFTGRTEEQVALVEAYAREQGMFHEPGAEEASTPTRCRSTSADVEPSLAGPRRPQDRVPLTRRQGVLPRASSKRLVEAGAAAPPATATSSASRARAATPRSGVEQQSSTAVEVTTARRALPARPRLGRDRRDHELHQHLQPGRDGGRRPAGQATPSSGGCARSRG